MSLYQYAHKGHQRIEIKHDHESDVRAHLWTEHMLVKAYREAVTTQSYHVGRLLAACCLHSTAFFEFAEDQCISGSIHFQLLVSVGVSRACISSAAIPKYFLCMDRASEAANSDALLSGAACWRGQEKG